MGGCLIKCRDTSSKSVTIYRSSSGFDYAVWINLERQNVSVVGMSLIAIRQVTLEPSAVQSIVTVHVGPLVRLAVRIDSGTLLQL